METQDTSAFYKLDPFSNIVIAGPNWVAGPYESYYLSRGQKDTYTYPIDGWYWFDSEEQAYNFFGIEWYPEIQTMGLSKPWLEQATIDEPNNIIDNA